MHAHILDQQRLRIPTHDEILLAEQSSKKLFSYITSAQEIGIQLIHKGKNSEVISIPPIALQLLAIILQQMAQGNAVTIMPVHSELTTQEAADLLNVSRPYLIKLLEEGKIPFRKVGTKRRISANDVLSYKNDIDQKRLDVLNKLANEAQKHDMGY